MNLGCRISNFGCEIPQSQIRNPKCLSNSAIRNPKSEIPLAPVIREVQRQAADHDLQSVVCVTAQHREMLDQVLHLFEITPDYDLEVMQEDQTLPNDRAVYPNSY